METGDPYGYRSRSSALTGRYASQHTQGPIAAKGDEPPICSEGFAAPTENHDVTRIQGKRTPDRNLSDPLPCNEPNLLPRNFDRVASNFVKHVDRSAGAKGCWPWTGVKQSKGYGSLGYLCADGKMRSFLAHRVAYMLATGKAMLPEIQVMHKCDNRPCCNPRHLFPGSQSDNMRDALNKGRMKIPGVHYPHPRAKNKDGERGSADRDGIAPHGRGLTGLPSASAGTGSENGGRIEEG